MFPKSVSQVTRTRSSSVQTLSTSASSWPPIFWSRTVTASCPASLRTSQMALGRFSSILNFTTDSDSDREDPLMCEFGGVGNSGLNTFVRERRILSLDLGDRYARRKVVQNDGHHYARALYARLAVAHRRVCDDLFFPVHGFTLLDLAALCQFRIVWSPNVGAEGQMTRPCGSSHSVARPGSSVPSCPLFGILVSLCVPYSTPGISWKLNPLGSCTHPSRQTIYTGFLL